MDFYDEMNALFLRMGMSEEAARGAAIGRYRSEAEARAAELTDDAEDLADEARDHAARRPSPAVESDRQRLAEISQHL